MYTLPAEPRSSYVGRGRAQAHRGYQFGVLDLMSSRASLAFIFPELIQKKASERYFVNFSRVRASNLLLMTLEAVVNRSRLTRGTF